MAKIHIFLIIPHSDTQSSFTRRSVKISSSFSPLFSNSYKLRTGLNSQGSICNRKQL